MIVTLTPNPSIDQTVDLGAELGLGLVQRATSISQVAGGKGVNVSLAMHKAGVNTLAVVPSCANDEFLQLLQSTGIPTRTLAAPGAVRVNVAITEPDGRTTKLNGPGPTHTPATKSELIAGIADTAADAHWAVLAGSLPGGLGEDFYPEVVSELRRKAPDCLIAVDTSDAPLRALAAQLHVAAPDLMKPNGEELGQILGIDGIELEKRACAGDVAPIAQAAGELVARGVRFVLITLGEAGAVLASPEGCWHAQAPEIDVVSTVGAGDSALSGFLLAHESGKPLPDCLRQAIAYGSTAASLPGTTIPAPTDVPIKFYEAITVTAL